MNVLAALHCGFTVCTFQPSPFPIHPVYSLNTCSSCQWYPSTPDVPRSASASQSPRLPRVSHIPTHWKKSVGPQDSCYWAEPSRWTEHRSCGKPRNKVLSRELQQRGTSTGQDLPTTERSKSPPHPSTPNSIAGKSGPLPQTLLQVNFICYCFSSGNESLVS